MKVFRSSFSAKRFCRRGSAITMGNYDGVHLGHRSIVKSLIAEAKKRGIPSVVYTFEPHPVKILAPQIAPTLINTLDQKIELLKSCGVDAMIVEKFNQKFALHTPIQFFEKFAVKRLKARFITVGYDFTFGAKRQGNIETLERLCFQHQIDVRIVDPFLNGNALVSSTLIRKYISEGKVKEVNPLIQRPFFIDGKVIRGRQRGSKLGIQTANLKTQNELIPHSGVYATRVQLAGKAYGAVTNIGYNPTFGKNPLSIETHLFRFKGRSYGRKMRIYFLERLRDEKKFDRPSNLVRQIHKDIEKAGQILMKKRK